MESGGKIRPPQGPKRKFEESCEKDMVDYLDYCWQIRIPRTQQRFGHELIHFMEFYGIHNDFKNVQPGMK